MALKVVFNPFTGELQYVNTGGSGTGATLTEETPTGDVDGSNTTFSVDHTPVFIVVDTRHLVESSNVSDYGGNAYTFSGGTIEVSADAPPLYFIKSYYNAT